MTDFKLDGQLRGLCCRGCSRQDNKLNTYDYLADIPGNDKSTDLVEVQFKNTRKGYYHNVNNLDLKKGDIVTVEATPGHDIGTVTLTGRLVSLQIKKANIRSEADIKKIYRIAKPVDLEKYEEAKSREHDTMIRSRQIAAELGLEMKIGDVEYQGDGNKAIFYYIADGRVDFRQLIKVLADVFKVRIEMKQIGARQEAGRIGGIGPCGRELCCATWMKDFVSVSTSAARFQDISLNPQKLAGQCAKLKCCMNYEVDAYVEAGKRLPSREITLETKDGEWFFFKADIMAGLLTYSSDKHLAANLVTISAARAFEIIRMNRNGQKPEALDEHETDKNVEKRSLDLAEQDDLTRFDKAKKKKKKNKGPKGPKPEEGASLNKEGDSVSETPNEDTKNSERPQKPERKDREGRSERRERGERGERPRRDREHGERRQERRERPAGEQPQDRAERPERGDRPERQERRQERRERPAGEQPQDRAERPERGDRPERQERRHHGHGRHDRHDRGEHPQGKDGNNSAEGRKDKGNAPQNNPE